MNVTNTTGHGHHGLELVSWRWDVVGSYVLHGIFVLIAAGIKIVYHHIPVLSSMIPESSILILIGALVGFLIHFTGTQSSENVPKFSSMTFFYILLPPIILEAAYSLYERSFFSNLATILLYAILGTLMNILLIAGTLYACSYYKVLGVDEMGFSEIMIFSTLIAAVDPVAVLAIFQEVNVNKALYFLVFGESLLNDAVVITMYNSVSALAVSETVSVVDILKAILGFIVVSIGGLILGILFGAVSSLVTKYTKDVRVVEPLVVLMVAYLSYTFAELFHFSGIISLIGCGLTQVEYTRHNLSTKSYTTVKYMIRTLSAVSDVIIFILLGIVLVRDDHQWNTGFVAVTVSACVIYRFFSVFFLTFIVNHIFKRVRKIRLEEQIVMAYGGLRGAIAFSLVITLDASVTKQNKLFTTTTLFVIIFTVFILGSTTKPLVKLLQLQSKLSKSFSLFLEANDRMMDTSMLGVEGVTGHHSFSYAFNKLSNFNDRCIKRFLISGHTGTKKALKETYDAIFQQKMEAAKEETKTTSGFFQNGFMNLVRRASLVETDRRGLELTSSSVQPRKVVKVTPQIGTVYKGRPGSFQDNRGVRPQLFNKREKPMTSTKLGPDQRGRQRQSETVSIENLMRDNGKKVEVFSRYLSKEY